MKGARAVHNGKFIKNRDADFSVCSEKLGHCVSLYNDTMERCHIGSRSLPRYVEKIRNIFATKSANKHPHMQQFTAL